MVFDLKHNYIPSTTTTTYNLLPLEEPMTILMVLLCHSFSCSFSTTAGACDDNMLSILFGPSYPPQGHGLSHWIQLLEVFTFLNWFQIRWTGFIGESVSYCLDWNGFFLVFRVWTQVGRCTTSYLLAGPACLWCLVVNMNPSRATTQAGSTQVFITTKGVLVRQVISLDFNFKWLH
jgi:hypothetical protein